MPLREILECGRQPRYGWNEVNIYESEGDCTSEMGRGQFSIFGAIEEKTCHGFATNLTDEEPRVREVANGPDRESFCAHGVGGRKFGGVGLRIVHRACTGNAERQFLV